MGLLQRQCSNPDLADKVARFCFWGMFLSMRVSLKETHRQYSMQRIEGMWAIRTRISWHKKLLDVLKRCTLAIVAPGIPYLLALSRGTGTVKEQLRFLYLYATHVWFALSPRTRKIAFNRMPLQLLPICVDYWHEQKVLSSFSRQRKNDVFGLVGCQIVLALQLVVYWK